MRIVTVQVIGEKKKYERIIKMGRSPAHIDSTAILIEDTLNVELLPLTNISSSELVISP